MDTPQHARDQAAVHTVGLPAESAPKKAKVGLSAYKLMATVFWDARSVIHIDYLQNGRTFNGEYYTNLLDRFNEEKEKTTAFGQEKSSFSSRQFNSPYVCCFHWRTFTNYAMNCSLIRSILRI